jgi:hypothetical protein
LGGSFYGAKGGVTPWAAKNRDSTNQKWNFCIKDGTNWADSGKMNENDENPWSLWPKRSAQNNS